MYDYEFTPQSTSRLIDMGICRVQNIVWEASRDTDGAIYASIPEIDGASLDAAEALQGVPVFGVGFASPYSVCLKTVLG